LKVAHTAFVVILVPVYARWYGPGNFLWFSDVALLVSVPALWLESPLLASTQCVSVIGPESIWIADLATGLVRGRYPIGLAAYMTDSRIPRSVRALSLFHLWLVPLLLLIVARKGYDRRAFRYQVVATWVILWASWRWTSPEANVNWVHGRAARRPSRARSRPRARRVGSLVVLMAALPLLVHLPAHLLLKKLFPPAR
jgi:hypothetical protein